MKKYALAVQVLVWCALTSGMIVLSSSPELMDAVNRLFSSKIEMTYVIIPLIAITFTLLVLLQSPGQRSLLEVDDRNRKQHGSRLVAPMNGSPSDSENGSSEMSETMQDANRIKDFYEYFEDLIEGLSRRIEGAEEKASILLTQGTRYAIGGVGFGLISVGVWQALALSAGGFQEQHMWGAVSTTLIFVFIEFLSGWYLKQYRQFIDTALYLTKIRTILQRFQLTYLLMKEWDEDEEARRRLLLLVTSEITWPEDHVLKKADINFARDMLESIGEIARGFKETAKEASGKSGNGKAEPESTKKSEGTTREID